MKERPILFNALMVRAILEGRKTQTRRIVNQKLGLLQFCPFGNVGDRLWVRETFAQLPNFADVVYRADGEAFKDFKRFLWHPKWTPSIHMPRKLSRIDLEITKVRVERLQDIDPEDAIKEGIDDVLSEQLMGDTFGDYSPDEIFSVLWESINGEGAWNKNPWVWVIESERIK